MGRRNRRCRDRVARHGCITDHVGPRKHLGLTVAALGPQRLRARDQRCPRRLMPRVSAVLMLTNAIAPDKLGGLDGYVRELSAALVSLGLPVTVLAKRVSPDDPPVEIGKDGVRIHRHRVPDKRKRAFALQYPAYVSAGVVGQLRVRQPGCLVHCHYPFTSLPLVFTSLP